jgi:hypothetical protein
MMDSDELFNKSLLKGGKSMKGKIGRTPQETRAFAVACRNGYARAEPRPRLIDLGKLGAAIDDGSVWQARNAGPVIIRIWCEWVAGERPLPYGASDGKVAE